MFLFSKEAFQNINTKFNVNIGNKLVKHVIRAIYAIEQDKGGVLEYFFTLYLSDENLCYGKSSAVERGGRSVGVVAQ